MERGKQWEAAGADWLGKAVRIGLTIDGIVGRTYGIKYAHNPVFYCPFFRLKIGLEPPYGQLA